MKINPAPWRHRRATNVFPSFSDRFGEFTFTEFPIRLRFPQDGHLGQLLFLPPGCPAGLLGGRTLVAPRGTLGRRGSLGQLLPCRLDPVRLVFPHGCPAFFQSLRRFRRGRGSSPKTRSGFPNLYGFIRRMPHIGLGSPHPRTIFFDLVVFSRSSLKKEDLRAGRSASLPGRF